MRVCTMRVLHLQHIYLHMRDHFATLAAKTKNEPLASLLCVFHIDTRGLRLREFLPIDWYVHVSQLKREWIFDAAKEWLKLCAPQQNAETAADADTGLSSAGFPHYTSHLLLQKPHCIIASWSLANWLLKKGSHRLHTHLFIFLFLFLLLHLLWKETLIGF